MEGNDVSLFARIPYQHRYQHATRNIEHRSHIEYRVTQAVLRGSRGVNGCSWDRTSGGPDPNGHLGTRRSSTLREPRGGAGQGPGLSVLRPGLSSTETVASATGPARDRSLAFLARELDLA